ncbi:MAG: phosphatidate cytidylyltransferase [Anaerolineae bacterium]|nr:hypothetical protein [Thermoflexales bacterium]MDW8406260.1 phosphatidate cytidylyltransferase [Anaerolineae bacterium]
MTDALAILISFVYVFFVLGLAEGLRRVIGWGVDFTRKGVHIGVGMWAFGTAALFDSLWAAIVPPAAFVLINYASYRLNLFQAMESEDKSNIGTILFPLAFIAMILIFFERSRPLFVAALMPLTWGDAFAAIIGRRWGRHRYTVAGARRSAEGTAAMLGFSFLAVAGALAVWGWPIGNALLYALCLACLSALAEAFSPAGLDNLTVPAAGVLAWALFQTLWPHGVM